MLWAETACGIIAPAVMSMDKRYESLKERPPAKKVGRLPTSQKEERK